MEKKLAGSTEVFSSLAMAEQAAGMDAASKRLLRHKEVLAVILKGTVEEYRDYSTEEIMGFIEADSITSPEVSRGRTNTVIGGSPTEFTELNEKTSLFDVFFWAKNPGLSGSKVLVNLHVDIEPQLHYRPGYPIEKRGIYYLSRSLGAQLGLLTKNTDYGSLEKCYSIWICRDHVPRGDRFSISHYRMENTENVGECAVEREDYDLLHLVIVRLGSPDYPGEDYDLFRFLNAVFYPHQKGFRRIIEHYIDFSGNEELQMEVSHMDGLGMRIVEECMEKGLQEGMEKGLQEGIKALVESCKEFGIAAEDARQKVQEKFSLTAEEADGLMEKYWK